MGESNAFATITRPRRRCCTSRQRVVVGLLSKHWVWVSGFAHLCAVTCRNGTTSPGCHLCAALPACRCRSSLQKLTCAQPFALRKSPTRRCCCQTAMKSWGNGAVNAVKIEPHYAPRTKLGSKTIGRRTGQRLTNGHVLSISHTKYFSISTSVVDFIRGNSRVARVAFALSLCKAQEIPRKSPR